MSDWSQNRYSPPDAPTAVPPKMGPDRFTERTTPDEWAEQADPAHWESQSGYDPTIDHGQDFPEPDSSQMTRAGELTQEEKIKENKKGGMVAFMCPRALAEEIVDGVPEAVPAEDLHVTLCVFDSLPPDEESKEEVIEVVRKVTKEYGPVTLRITGLGQFDPKDGLYPTVALMTGNGLAALRTDIVRALKEHDIPIKENFDFTPHLSLAYLKEESDFHNHPHGEWTADEVEVVFGGEVHEVPLGGEVRTAQAQPGEPKENESEPPQDASGDDSWEPEEDRINLDDPENGDWLSQLREEGKKNASLAIEADSGGGYWESWSHAQQVKYIKDHPKTKKRTTKGKDPRDEKGDQAPAEPPPEEPAEQLKQKTSHEDPTVHPKFQELKEFYGYDPEFVRRDTKVSTALQSSWIRSPNHPHSVWLKAMTAYALGCPKEKAIDLALKSRVDCLKYWAERTPPDRIKLWEDAVAGDGDSYHKPFQPTSHDQILEFIEKDTARLKAKLMAGDGSPTIESDASGYLEIARASDGQRMLGVDWTSEASDFENGGGPASQTAAQAFLAMREEFLKTAKEAGLKEITLYRGVKGDLAKKLRECASMKQQDCVADTSILSSFTDRISSARTFTGGESGCIIRMRVPIEQIAAHYRCGGSRELENEKEVLVAPGEDMSLTGFDVLDHDHVESGEEETEIARQRTVLTQAAAARKQQAEEPDSKPKRPSLYAGDGGSIKLSPHFKKDLSDTVESMILLDLGEPGLSSLGMVQEFEAYIEKGTRPDKSPPLSEQIGLLTEYVHLLAREGVGGQQLATELAARSSVGVKLWTELETPDKEFVGDFAQMAVIAGKQLAEKAKANGKSLLDEALHGDGIIFPGHDVFMDWINREGYTKNPLVVKDLLETMAMNEARRIEKGKAEPEQSVKPKFTPKDYQKAETIKQWDEAMSTKDGKTVSPSDFTQMFKSTNGETWKDFAKQHPDTFYPAAVEVFGKVKDRFKNDPDHPKVRQVKEIAEKMRKDLTDNNLVGDKLNGGWWDAIDDMIAWKPKTTAEKILASLGFEAASDYWSTWSYEQQVKYISEHPKTKKKPTRGKDPRDEAETPSDAPQSTPDPGPTPDEPEDVEETQEEEEAQEEVSKNPPAESPRGEAESTTKKMVDKGEYINDRASAVEQRGEDVMGSARAKAAVWKSLKEALDSGEADKMFTRDFLARQEPLELIARTQAGNAGNALAQFILHLDERKFPSKPDIWEPGPEPEPGAIQRGGFATYDGKRFTRGYGDYMTDGKVSREEHIKRQRESYYDAYKEVRGIIDRYSKMFSTEYRDPTAITSWHGDLTRDVLKKFHEYSQERGRSDAGTEALRKCFNALRGGKLSPLSQANDFASRMKSVHPEVQDQQDKMKDYVLKVMEGQSIPAAFDQKSERKGYAVELTDMYDTSVMTRKGPESQYKGVKQGLDTLDKDGKFKMRGVQWGKSVTDEEREHHLKSLVDSWSDLTEILGLPSEMASYNGKLAIAIGARGVGNALAHYEPSLNVINLTRANGAGSLAHEWGHFFDFAVGQVDDTVRDFDGKEKGRPLTSGPRWKVDPSKTRQAVKDLTQSEGWKKFRTRLDSALKAKGITKYGKDGEPSKQYAYWTSDLEMFARTFERHVQRKLHKAERENTYLVALKKAASTEDGLWPTDDEADSMTERFDKIFEEFKGDAKLRTALKKFLANIFS